MGNYFIGRCVPFTVMGIARGSAREASGHLHREDAVRGRSNIFATVASTTDDPLGNSLRGSDLNKLHCTSCHWVVAGEGMQLLDDTVSIVVDGSLALMYIVPCTVYLTASTAVAASSVQ